MIKKVIWKFFKSNPEWNYSIPCGMSSICNWKKCILSIKALCVNMFIWQWKPNRNSWEKQSRGIKLTSTHRDLLGPRTGLGRCLAISSRAAASARSSASASSTAAAAAAFRVGSSSCLFDLHLRGWFNSYFLYSAIDFNFLFRIFLSLIDWITLKNEMLFFIFVQEIFIYTKFNWGFCVY